MAAVLGVILFGAGAETDCRLVESLVETECHLAILTHRNSTNQLQKRFVNYTNVVIQESIQDFIRLVTSKRVIFAVDYNNDMALLSSVYDLLQKDDILINCAYEQLTNTIKCYNDNKLKEIGYLSMKIYWSKSFKGPCLLCSGEKTVYQEILPILAKLIKLSVHSNSDDTVEDEIQEENNRFCAFIGPIGVADFIYSIEQTIEYSTKCTINEIYKILNKCGSLSSMEICNILSSWSSEHDYLLNMTASLIKKEPTATDVMTKVLSVIPSTTLLLLNSAVELGTEVPNIYAIMAYAQAQRRANRGNAELQLKIDQIPQIEPYQIINDTKSTYLLVIACIYSQCFMLLEAASAKYNWDVNIADALRLLNTGSHIRSTFLNELYEEYRNATGKTSNILLFPSILRLFTHNNDAWRRVITLCYASGISCWNISSALNYFDGLSP